MDSIFKIAPAEDTKLQTYKDEAMKELNEFFDKDWVLNTPKIFVVDDRKTINLLREEETKDYITCWSYGTLAIFVLNPKYVSKESSHDESNYNLKQRIKHELCHSFFYLFFGKSNFSWINEGIAIYVSGELSTRYPMPGKFEGFLDNKNVYLESGNAIKLIIEKFGKDKLFEFLKKQRGIEDKEILKKIFMDVFGAELNYDFFNSLQEKSSN